MEDLVDLQEQFLHNIVAYQLEIDLANEVRYILLAAREEVVHTDDLQCQAPCWFWYARKGVSQPVIFDCTHIFVKAQARNSAGRNVAMSGVPGSGCRAYMVAPLDEICAKVRADKTSASRHQDSIPFDPGLCFNLGLPILLLRVIEILRQKIGFTTAHLSSP